jgi:FkbM family methyltransferase
MNFSGISGRSLLGKAARFALRFIPADTVMPILQGPLRGKRWIVGSSNHGCWLGSYEYDKRRVFERMIAQGDIVYDIGAHVGYYTLLSSILVGDCGQVVAFEPLPANLVYLKQHLKLNRIANVALVEAAVSDHGGYACFHPGSNNYMGYIADDGILTVKSVSLDELYANDQIPVPDLIKIDVEGAEILVLSGAKNLLTAKRPILFLATHGIEIHRQCLIFLGDLDYRLQPLNGVDLENCDEILGIPNIKPCDSSA